MKTLQKALAVSVLAAISGYASAAPIFSFVESAGFEIDDVAYADYTGANAIGGIDPSVATSDVMSWYKGGTTQSSLILDTFSEANVLANTWYTITTLSHDNTVIFWPGPGASPTGWLNQSVYGVFSLYDNGNLLFSDESIVEILELDETPNVEGSCGPNNPLGSVCDDVFTVGEPDDILAGIEFLALDGSKWIAEFQFANFFNSAVDLPNIYTAEGEISSLDVQVRLRQVVETPEPATLSILGLGLIGLGLANRRKQNA